MVTIESDYFRLEKIIFQSVFPPPSHIMHPTDCHLLSLGTRHQTRTPTLQPRRPDLPELPLLPPVIPLTDLHQNPTTRCMSSADNAKTSCVFPASVQVLEHHLGDATTSCIGPASIQVLALHLGDAAAGSVASISALAPSHLLLRHMSTDVAENSSHLCAKNALPERQRCAWINMNPSFVFSLQHDYNSTYSVQKSS